jgi:hypothetical protein
MIAFFVLTYAAHSFLETSMESAAGSDRIIWPDEPIMDWLWKLWYLLWLLGVWAAPSGLLYWMGKISLLTFGLSLAGVLWVIIPISLLSAESAVSRLVVFRPWVAWLMLKQPLSTAVFYIVTGILLALCGGLAYQMVVSGNIFWVPVAAVVGAAGLLLYARLLGRMGWLLSQKAGFLADSEQSEEAESTEAGAGSATGAMATMGQTTQPAGRKKKRTGWRMRAAGTATAASASTSTSNDAGPVEGSYNMQAAVSLPSPEEQIRLARPVPAHAERPAHQTIVIDRPPPPAFPLFSGVYTFPFYPTTLVPFAKLTLGFLVMGLLFYLLAALLPETLRGEVR